MSKKTCTQNDDQTALSKHRRRCIAAFIYERTRHGKRTTCREVAAFLKVNPNTINSIIRRAQVEPTQISQGVVILVAMGKRTDTGGVKAETYAAIFHNQKSEQ